METNLPQITSSLSNQTTTSTPTEAVQAVVVAEKDRNISDEVKNKKWLEDYFSEGKKAALEQVLSELKRDNPKMRTLEDFAQLATTVVGEWELSGETHPTFNQWAKHLLNQVRLKNRILGSEKRTRAQAEADQEAFAQKMINNAIQQDRLRLQQHQQQCLPPTSTPAISESMTIPTQEEVEAFIQEEELDADPEAFWNYYESIGWVVGGKPMKNWKAACRKWKNDLDY